MRQNLLETYSRQLKVAEAYVAKNFEGKTMSSQTALTTAVLLDNTNRWITESLNSEIGATTRDSMGAWKRFCLNLTNIAVPSLIANDLVIVHPMTSYSGSVAYLEYVSLTDKGANGVKKGDVFNSVFGHGKMDEARMNFTSQIVVEPGNKASLDAEKDGLSYTEGTTVKFATYKFIGTKVVDGETVDVVAYGDTAPADMTVEKIAYVSKQFQMNHIPATEIPAIGPRMKHIPLVAEPRRIAVRYDQITAFQA